MVSRRSRVTNMVGLNRTPTSKARRKVTSHHDNPIRTREQVQQVQRDEADHDTDELAVAEALFSQADAFARYEGRTVMRGALGRAGLPDGSEPARGQPAQLVELVASGDVPGR